MRKEVVKMKANGFRKKKFLRKKEDTYREVERERERRRDKSI